MALGGRWWMVSLLVVAGCGTDSGTRPSDGGRGEISQTGDASAELLQTRDGGRPDAGRRRDGGAGAQAPSMPDVGREAGTEAQSDAAVAMASDAGGATPDGAAASGGRSDGGRSDAGSAAAGDFIEHPTDGPTSCDGVDCSSEGACFINVHGVAECACDPCRFPADGLRCLTVGQFCSDAIRGGFTCNDDASCYLPIDNCTCELEAPLAPICRCNPNEPEFYDGTQCVRDVRGCPDVAECTIGREPRFAIEVTGAASFTVSDRMFADWNWTSGYLEVFNDWPEALCGHFVLRGFAKDPGSYGATSIDFAVGYDERLWSTDNAGAGGTIVVNDWFWCDDFDCTVVDFELDVTLAAEDGSTVHASGYIRSQSF